MRPSPSSLRGRRGGFSPLRPSVDRCVLQSVIDHYDVPCWPPPCELALFRDVRAKSLADAKNILVIRTQLYKIQLQRISVARVSVKLFYNNIVVTCSIGAITRSVT